ncbi:SDR family oxidoreductase [Neolewinella litorea]|uniref:SDR family oxidoreductase n=1 Tax=Neolewinella litorea TaxID=2562452 RepID=A0A4S4NA17_9BACT|nr:SDR family oxidoreductase [Neolewinella litorea]THH34918.1 SDR family oxidoreductase [Neolewinella litorea]
MQLQGKVAIITGASSGIGEATAKKLAADGVKVVLAARRASRLNELKKEIEKAGGEALVVETDVTKPKDVKQLVEQTKAAFGPCDILVNNAGIMPLSYMKNLHVDEWLKMVDVNVNGVLHCLAETLPDMVERKQGHIVNISSVAGREVMVGSAVYSATKFAVRALSDGLRQELAPKHGIRVTCIEPGAVETELTETITDDELMNDIQDFFKDLKFLASEDIANAIHYAISQPDSVHINELQVRPTSQG